MGNLKHTMAALLAVSLVGSLATVQALNLSAVRANKLTQTIETTNTAPAVLTGDGEGETADDNTDNTAPATAISVGDDAYILTEGGSINLRAAADTESTILNVLSVGTQVKVIDIYEDWFKVQSGEYTGYVKAEYVSTDKARADEIMLATTMYRMGTADQSINVRTAADENALILSQVAQGSWVIILEQPSDGWYKVYYGDDYDVGYVSAEYITTGEMTERSVVNKARNNRIAAIAKNANIKTSDTAVAVKIMPDDNSETLTTLANNASCKILSGGTNWTKIIVSATNEVGYVKTSNVTAVEEKKAEVKAAVQPDKKNITKKSSSVAAAAPAASGNGSRLVSQAAKYIGTKYVYGGTSPSGFDCSGLVQYCCRALGVSVNRSAAAQFSNGKAVSRSDLQPGDLVFFSKGGGRITHVVIYAGNGQVIHAPRTGRTVCYQSLSSICEYSKYVGARRVM